MSPSVSSPRRIPNARLSDYTTLRVGGPCPVLFSCPSPEAAQEAQAAVREEGMGYIWMGGGSNLLVADRGLNLAVLRYVSPHVDGVLDGTGWISSACAGLDESSACLAAAGLQGLNFCSGIPGTLGGAVAGNAGAWGKQIGDVLDWADLLFPDGHIERCSAQDLQFQYRGSRLQHEPEILILRVCIRVHVGDRNALLEERRIILDERVQKHPDWRTTPTAGSFFRNVEATSAAERRQAAGWFLEQAGAKTFRVGGASLYPHHANIIIGSPGCSAEDVRLLAEKMKKAVRDQFGFELEPEVRMVGW